METKPAACIFTPTSQLTEMTFDMMLRKKGGVKGHRALTFCGDLYGSSHADGDSVKVV